MAEKTEAIIARFKEPYECITNESSPPILSHYEALLSFYRFHGVEDPVASATQHALELEMLPLQKVIDDVVQIFNARIEYLNNLIVFFRTAPLQEIRSYCLKFSNKKGISEKFNNEISARLFVDEHFISKAISNIKRYEVYRDYILKGLENADAAFIDEVHLRIFLELKKVRTYTNNQQANDSELEIFYISKIEKLLRSHISENHRDFLDFFDNLSAIDYGNLPLCIRNYNKSIESRQMKLLERMQNTLELYNSKGIKVIDLVQGISALKANIEERPQLLQMLLRNPNDGFVKIFKDFFIVLRENERLFKVFEDFTEHYLKQETLKISSQKKELALEPSRKSEPSSHSVEDPVSLEDEGKRNQEVLNQEKNALEEKVMIDNLNGMVLEFRKKQAELIENRRKLIQALRESKNQDRALAIKVSENKLRNEAALTKEEQDQLATIARNLGKTLDTVKLLTSPIEKGRSNVVKFSDIETLIDRIPNARMTFHRSSHCQIELPNTFKTWEFEANSLAYIDVPTATGGAYKQHGGQHTEDDLHWDARRCFKRAFENAGITFERLQLAVKAKPTAVIRFL